jgi:hypothetical protein
MALAEGLHSHYNHLIESACTTLHTAPAASGATAECSPAGRQGWPTPAALQSMHQQAGRLLLSRGRVRFTAITGQAGCTLAAGGSRAAIQ